jgi:predicted ATPase
MTLRNFRAYHQQSFEFARLNLFIGPNNSGKSSILSAINLLAQTINNRTTISSPLLLNGPFEELGTYQDVVHGNNPRTVFGIDFSINNVLVSFDVKYRTQRRELELIKFQLYDDNSQLYSFISKKDNVDIRLSGFPYSTFFGETTQKRPIFMSFWPFDANISRTILTSEREKVSNHAPSLREVDRGLRNSDMRIRDTFRNFDSLSPFRDQPKRTYLYTGESPTSIGRTGMNGINMLVNDSARRGSLRVGIEDQISRWLQINGIAKGIKVKNLTPRHFEVCIIDFKDKQHNICDVGFGCSQVLPVLVGGLNLFLRAGQPRHRAPIYVVQEPEIHLHPNAQASLGSFFVGLATFGGQLFVETHSDNLVVRAARHVARGDIGPEAIRIFYIEDQAGEKVVTEIGFDADGKFVPDWPGGFFPQRQTETLLLARARQAEKSSDIPQQLEFFYRN